MVTDPGPSHSAAISRTDAAQLQALKKRYPGWDIRRVFGGWEAVPAGTVIIRGAYLETIAEKLEKQ